MSFPYLCGNNMHQYLKILIIILTVNLAAVIKALPSLDNLYVYEPIPHADELLQKGMHRIFQDTDGFMWYGTNNGLYRSDGYNLKVFRADYHNQNLISDNFITYIEELGGNIWFGTCKGCYILDKSTLSISKVDTPSSVTDQNVFTISIVEGNSWVSYPGHLVKYDEGGHVLAQYEFTNGGCAYFVANHPGIGLVTSVNWQGMYRLNVQKDRFEPWCRDYRYKNVQRMTYDRRNQCWWLGTWGQGIVRFDPSDQSGNCYTPQSLPVNAMGETIGNTYHMIQDDDNILWVTTTRDLCAFEIDENKTLHQLDLGGLLPPGKKLLYEIYKDRDGFMWVSSFDDRSFIIKPKERSHHVFNNEPLDALIRTAESIPAVDAFAFAGKFLWVMQNRGALYRIDLHTNTVTQYADPDGKTVKGFAKSDWSGHSVWAYATWGRTLKLYSDKNNGAESVSAFDFAEDGRVNTAYEDREGSVWVGANNGLYRHDVHMGHNTRINGYNTVAITGTSDNKIWSVSAQGLITSYLGTLLVDSLSTGLPINVISATTDGCLWFGTAHGDIFTLNTGNPAETFAYHTRQCDMNGDAVINLVVDKFNHIWISTNSNIIEYNPRNSAIRRWDTQDPGIAIDRILPNSSWVKDDGNIAFGGMGGITTFSPSHSIESIPENVKIYITDVNVDGRSVLAAKDNSNFSGEGVELSSDASNITIEFSTLNHHNIPHIRYAYRLSGVDKDWVYLPAGSNSAFYNRIGCGTHKLQIKATDGKGLWSDNICIFSIYRKPHWYETWWIRVLAVVILASTALLIWQAYIRRTIQREREKVYDSDEFKRLYSYIENHNSVQINDNIDSDIAVMDRIKSVVVGNMADVAFDINRLAQAVGMSRSTLSRKIKSLTGKTTLEYIKDIKLEHAAAMLRKRNMSVGEVIGAVGYSDYKNFARIFREKFGVLPRDYQKTQSPGYTDILT